ncbi:hypothetical protein ACK9YZ_06985 [Rhizobium sp. ZK1]|uniref:hypothetical protein n=1 Tax=Rhizobium sp. ZK1 TaxID=3389872 RepID=UPI0039F65AD4
MEFYENIFWYTDPSGIVLSNAKLNEGWTESVSSFSDRTGLEGATTPYAALHLDREKEALWEKIRADEFPDRPTRLKALFLFVSRADAETAMQTWFRGQDRDFLAIQVPKTSNLHVGDSKHLDAAQSDWDSAARSYWAGHHTAEPFLEGVLYGKAFVHNWQSLQPRLRRGF